MPAQALSVKYILYSSSIVCKVHLVFHVNIAFHVSISREYCHWYESFPFLMITVKIIKRQYHHLRPFVTRIVANVTVTQRRVLTGCGNLFIYCTCWYSASRARERTPLSRPPFPPPPSFFPRNENRATLQISSVWPRNSEFPFLAEESVFMASCGRAL